jgi:integrase
MASKKKRGNGEGSIYQRKKDGRWVAQVHRDDGPPKYYYGATREDVKGKLTKALHDLQEGLPLTNDRQTVEEYLKGWLTSTAQHRLRPRTFVRYQQLVRTHTLPTLGKLPLSKLTPQHLSHLYGAKLAEGLSPRTVQFLHAVLHGALRQALLGASSRATRRTPRRRRGRSATPCSRSTRSRRRSSCAPRPAIRSRRSTCSP